MSAPERPDIELVRRQAEMQISIIDMNLPGKHPRVVAARRIPHERILEALAYIRQLEKVVVETYREDCGLGVWSDHPEIATWAEATRDAEDDAEDDR